MEKKKTPKSSSARDVMNRRLYEGKPERIEERERTARDMSLGMKIRRLRENARMTQAELAHKIGTQSSAISRLEDADYDGHSMATLEKVAMALEMRLVIDFQAMPKVPPMRPAKMC